jgi:signal transduction histidine kinase
MHPGNLHALRDAQGDLLAEFLRRAQAGIVLVDREARVREWNPALERTTGLRREEVLGELLCDVIFRSFPAEQQRLLERALGEARQMAGLVNELIDTADLESGRLQLSMEEVDIRRMIEEALGATRAMAEQRAVKQAYAPAHSPGPLRANPARLKQVLVRLLENAIRVSATGGPVLVTSHTEGGEVVVQVIDRGPGIPADLEPAVFEQGGLEAGDPPARLDLYLCKRVIEAHGGSIGVHSQLGVGSTFFFSLPTG